MGRVSKAFWLTFVAVVAVGLIAGLVVFWSAHPECASIPEDVGVCDRAQRLEKWLPATLVFSAPVGLVAGVAVHAIRNPKKA